VARAENYHIVLRFHFESGGCKFMLTSSMAKQTSNAS
jgi:hypothetical protein